MPGKKLRGLPKGTRLDNLGPEVVTATKTTSQTTITTEATITGLTATVPQIAGRKYRASVVTHPYCSAGTDFRVVIRIKVDSTTIQQSIQSCVSAGNLVVTHTVFGEWTATNSEEVDVTITYAQTAGGNTFNQYGDTATFTNRISVDLIG